MNYFLVDYENVWGAGLEGIDDLTEDDVVVIFYSDKADTLTFDLHNSINASPAAFYYQKVTVGEKNALDFQLCSYLGFLIRDTLNVSDEPSEYYIVSNDHGFAMMSEYWEKNGVRVNNVSNLIKKPFTSPTDIKQITLHDNEALTKALKTVLTTKNDIATVKQIIFQSKTKLEVNNNISKKFNNKTGKIYQAIKPFLANKPGSVCLFDEDINNMVIHIASK